MKETTSSDSRAGYLRLIRTNHNFRNLWYGQIVSLLGDWFNLIASAALISRLSGSSLAIGGLFVVRMLAPFLISPMAGVIADRYNRKHVLIITDLSRAAVVFGFLLIRDPDDIWLLYVLTALQLAISGIFFPTRNAILPDLVAPEELGTANALSSTTWSVMLALGAALGGLVAGGWGISPAFIIDALTFLLSAVFIARIHYRPLLPVTTADLRPTTVLSEYLAGLRYLKDQIDILIITLQKAVWGLVAGGAFQVLQVEISKGIFPIGEGGGISLGILYAVAGVGTGIGPLLTRRFTGDRERPLRMAIALGYGLTTIGLIVIATLSSLLVVSLGNFVRAFGGGLNWVFSTQLLLMLVPARVRGRIFATEFAFFTLASAISTAAGGWALERASLSYEQLMLVMGVGSMLVGVLWLAWITFRRVPEPPPVPLMETTPVSQSFEHPVATPPSEPAKPPEPDSQSADI